MTDRSRRLNKRMDDLFPAPSSECRVCGEAVEDGRRRYCSDRCRDIASAVQAMFTWSSVRDRVLERDDHTCQSCGADVSEDADADAEVDHIQAMTNGGHPLDEQNLRTLCSECHQDKTREDLTDSRPDQELTLADYLESDAAATFAADGGDGDG